MHSKAKAVVGYMLEATITPILSVIESTFGVDFSRLPPDVKVACHVKYQRWRKNPGSLNFEPKFANWYAVEITRDHHAVCQVEGLPTAATVYWRRVMSYNDYRNYLDSRRKNRLKK